MKELILKRMAIGPRFIADISALNRENPGVPKEDVLAEAARRMQANIEALEKDTPAEAPSEEAVKAINEFTSKIRF